MNEPKQMTKAEVDAIQYYQESAVYRPNLSELMWGYKNAAANFIADRVAPWMMVPTTKGQYRVLNADTFFNRNDTRLDKRAYPKEIGWGDSFSNYDLIAYGQSIFLADIERDTATQMYGSLGKWRMVNTEALAHALRLDREARVMSLITTSGNYANSTTLTGGDQWSSYNTSNPRKDILSGHELIAKYGVIANTVVVDIATHFKLLQHPSVIATISGGATKARNAQAIVNEEVLTQYFGVQNYLVAAGVYNSTPEQSSTTLTNIMGDFCALLYVDTQAGGNELLPTFARSLVFAPQANIASGGWMVKSVRDERAGGSGGEYLQGWYYAQEKVIASGLGYLIMDTLA